MNNNEKAKEITSQLKFGTSLSPIVNDRIYDASIKMAEWKERQLKEVCEKHCLSHIEQEGKRCVWLSIEGKHCWEIENQK